MNVIKKAVLDFPLISIFSMNKIVKSKALNKLGIQSFRMKLAQKRYKSRSFSTDPIVKNELKELKEYGIVQINDFLSTEDFKNLKSECRSLCNSDLWTTITKMGPNVIRNIDLKTLDIEQYPAIKKLIKDYRIHALFEGAEKRKIRNSDRNYHLLLQYLVQGPGDDHDPETDLHSDTFFNTHKAWLYLDDVNLENGPFVYVKSSHKADSKFRRDKESEYSKRNNVKGSRRIPISELEEQGLSESVYTCSKNTFVMANTLGYHRRLKGEPGNDRLTFAISARYNPFF